ncbi:MAG: beta-L-arabinofuranosidase domain-containing protein [Planctomycetota bacterium]
MLFLTILLRVLGVAGAPIGIDEATFVDRVPAAGENPHYVGHRPPLAPSPLLALPPGAVRPEGWLRTQLEREAAGFVGHLGEISSFLRREGNAWLSPTGAGHSGWEELPYWLKGFGDLGYVLGDERIVAEARVWIEAILASQDADGWFGPRSNRTRLQTDRGGKPDLWPNMLALRGLRSWHEHSGDERVLALMTRYFRWQLSVPDADFLLPDWQQQRAADELANVHWLYDRLGEPWLLELAEKIHRHTANWTDGVANWHGVNIAQAFRGPAGWWAQSRDPRHLAATERNLGAVLAEYGQVPGGLWAADENCRPGFTDARQAAETCTMVELMLSAELLAGWTGDPKWADRGEEVAFNSLPAALTADLRALHYLTAPNLVRCDAASKAPGLQNGGPMLRFDPHDHRCCQHNVAHGWPYFAEHAWMATADRGLAAVLLAPTTVTAKVADGTIVTLRATTSYPFGEDIAVRVATPAPVRFPLYLRVPAWCARPELAVNGQALPLARAGPGFARLERTWADGDEVRLHLSMAIEVRRWPAQHGAVSVHRGPLAYSLRIAEKLVPSGGTDAWPAWEILPASPWNYALVLDETDPAASFTLVRREMPPDGQPFEHRSAPLELVARGRRVPEWTEDPLGLVGPLQASPVRTAEPIEEIALIPMGCARLRVAVFPVAGAGPDARAWVAPEK